MVTLATERTHCVKGLPSYPESAQISSSWWGHVFNNVITNSLAPIRSPKRLNTVF
jgi:hypothetical protein